MRNYCMVLAYDGTRYSGWQRQKDQPTIQETLEGALARITGEKVAVNGAGRTDAGVHALRQVANFHSGTSLQAGDLKRAVNAVIPKDIRVMSLAEVPDGFHARKSASGKRYAYRMHLGEVPTPFGRSYFANIKFRLSLESMRKGADIIRGERDFAAFGTNPGYELATTVRRVDRLHFIHKSPFLWMVVQGNGFLYNMVRTMAGTLVEVGRGRITPARLHSILESRDRREAGPVLPAGGLFMLRVLYKENEYSSIVDGASLSKGSSRLYL